MCGIALWFSEDPGEVSHNEIDQSNITTLFGKDLSTLLHRGPESWSHRAINLPEHKVRLITFECILSQRGLAKATFQSLNTASGANGSVYHLLWNGEVFDHTDAAWSLAFRELENNDANVLLSLIAKSSGTTEELVKTFASLRGPFAFILIELPSGRVYFGRDRFGRRSLVGRRMSDSSSSTGIVFDTISSVVLPSSSEANTSSTRILENWTEIPAVGVYCAHLHWIENSFYLDSITVHPWTETHSQLLDTCGFNVAHIAPPLPQLWTMGRQSMSVSMKKPQDAVDQFSHLLSEAVQERVRLASSRCISCSRPSVDVDDIFCGSHHTRFGVLFSGGLDSTVLALLCNRFVPDNEPIDLINVAFDQSVLPHSSSHGPTKSVSASEAPDRKTGWQSFLELSRIAPTRKWQFITVDVSVDELRRIRSTYILQLLQPGALTVLDDSLGLAIWFAARGRGTMYQSPKDETLAFVETPTQLDYTSTAKVVFVGSGIDEQLAGYTRHRAIFEKQGLDALEKELQMEINRISERNMGRDDRMISDHGREARFPYLDEKVTDYLRELPFSLKADLTLPRGVGEKLLLRQVATRLGLTQAAGLPKRAMQFGSRIAKADTGGRRLVGAADQIRAPLGDT